MARPRSVVHGGGHGYVHEMASPPEEATVVLHDVLHPQKQQAEGGGAGGTSSGATVFGCAMTATGWESRAAISRRISHGQSTTSCCSRDLNCSLCS